MYSVCPSLNSFTTGVFRATFLHDESVVARQGTLIFVRAISNGGALKGLLHRITSYCRSSIGMFPELQIQT
jgi:hypothetical protein